MLRIPQLPPQPTASQLFSSTRAKDAKTSQGLLRHAKASTTLDLYSQAMDESKLAAQRDIAVAITGSQAQAN
jgi:hypothetical protein